MSIDYPRIRWASDHDLETITEISDKVGSNRSIDYYRDLKRQKNVVGQVVEVRGQVIGFMYYRLYRDSFEIVELTVDPDHKLAGIGTMLVDFLLQKIRSPMSKRHTVWKDVSEANLDAHLFLRKLGFLAKGIQRNQFDGLDGYRFKHTVGVAANT